tara:strand:+ start:451 stop:1113 length:663 start_codon:yes stop_codon:yes gene_type:complete
MALTKSQKKKIQKQAIDRYRDGLSTGEMIDVLESFVEVSKIVEGENLRGATKAGTLMGCMADTVGPYMAESVYDTAESMGIDYQANKAEMRQLIGTSTAVFVLKMVDKQMDSDENFIEDFKEASKSDPTEFAKAMDYSMATWTSRSEELYPKYDGMMSDMPEILDGLMSASLGTNDPIPKSSYDELDSLSDKELSARGVIRIRGFTKQDGSKVKTHYRKV